MLLRDVTIIHLFLEFHEKTHDFLHSHHFNKCLTTCTVCKTLIATYQFFNSRHAHNDIIEMCNTAMEGEFCGLSESVGLQNVRPLMISTN